MRGRERERQRARAHLLDHFTNTCNRQGHAEGEDGSQKANSSLTQGWQRLHPWVINATSQATHQQEARIQSRVWNQETENPPESPLWVPKHLSHLLVLSRVSLQRAGSEVEGLGLKQDNLWNTGTAGSGLTHCAMTMVCKLIFNPTCVWTFRNTVKWIHTSSHLASTECFILCILTTCILQPDMQTALSGSSIMPKKWTHCITSSVTECQRIQSHS